MGFTRYLWQDEPFADVQWSRIVSAFGFLYEEMPETTEPFGGFMSEEPLTLDDGDGGEPICDNAQIVFNGADSPGEVFYLERSTIGFFHFKTARRPYDLMVGATLLAAKFIAPGAITIDADGGEEAVAPVEAFFEHVCRLHPEILEWRDSYA
ncbi:hypothetical protein [Thioalkalivibrio sp. ALE16]|uniref:hypothetical protein n=1 Tax=Thioalkalivibrio sp. ALE16 TaxID=1158172 RepID=UPI00035E6A28|nr:hypothetical protein [Thioalkalivibrio sp. ALE16]